MFVIMMVDIACIIKIAGYVKNMINIQGSDRLLIKDSCR